MPTLFVIIPYYDEPATLEQCLRRVVDSNLPADWRQEIILVDDHSGPEGGRCADEVVSKLGQEGVGIRLERHDHNRGKGAAVRTGFRSALRDAGDEDVMIIQDADLEYDPRDFPLLLEPLAKDDADVVYGNRWNDERDDRTSIGRMHRLGNSMLTAFSNMLTGYRISDMECCYKAFPVPVLRRILGDLDEERFGIEPQLTASLSRHGYHVTEVPVRYEPRGFKAGKKIGLADGFSALRVMLRERFRRSADR